MDRTAADNDIANGLRSVTHAEEQGYLSQEEAALLLKYLAGAAIGLYIGKVLGERFGSLEAALDALVTSVGKSFR